MTKLDKSVDLNVHCNTNVRPKFKLPLKLANFVINIDGGLAPDFCDFDQKS